MTQPDAPPIVVFGDDWGRHVSTMQHVFRHIVEHRRVFWVNAIGHRVPQLGPSDLKRAADKLRRATRGGPAAKRVAVTIADQVRPEVVIEPRVLPWHHYRPVHQLNTWSLTRSIKQALASRQVSQRPVVVTGSPPSVGVLGKLDELASVYFCMDDFLHLPGVTASMIAPLEKRLLGKVDLLVATAQRLTETKIPASGNTAYLPQGVNYHHFAEPLPTPPEMASLTPPVIGFAGAISDCCDLALLERLANDWPNASLALVGPITMDPSPLKALADLPNVHFLGPKPYQDLPAYVQGFDVGLIPYLLNDWTRSVDPLKLLEYLAAGIPVVTTAIPEVIKYQQVVSVAETHDDFTTAVGQTLAGQPRAGAQARDEVARANMWQGRAERLLEMLDDLVARDGADSHAVSLLGG